MPMINPFRPTRPVSSTLFGGRRAEINRIATALRQTRAGNPTHFLVLGERGIGKSSFLRYVEDLATGTAEGERHAFRFLVVHTDINESVGSVDLARKIKLGFENVLDKNERSRKFLADAWGFLERLEVMGTSIEERQRPAILDDPTVEQFCYSLADTVDRIVEGTGPLTAKFDGVVILIDESDRMGDHLDLGAFAKNLLERLERRRCNRLVLGMAGLPGVLERLAASHESAPRLFQHVELCRLSRSEGEEVIDRGLELARDQNEADIAITDAAKSRIVKLSDGHPHLLQQFSYSAFEEDQDAYIDEEDLELGIFGPNGALETVGNIYYRPRFEQPGFDEVDRAVLRALAVDCPSWTGMNDILNAVSVQEDALLASLEKLARKKLVTRDPAGASSFRIGDQTFCLWVHEHGGSLTEEDQHSSEGREPRTG